MKLCEALNKGRNKRETLWLLEKVTGLTSTEIQIKSNCVSLSQSEISIFCEMLDKLAHNVPLQYILGDWEFMGLPFKCRTGVLIPRADTEILVENAISYIKNEKKTVLDLCTGSGCIAVSIAKYCPNTKVFAADISTAALALAKENALLNGVLINLKKSDIFNEIAGKYDYIISNPPYIAYREIENLQEEVRHEPVIALDGGADGLDYYRKIIPMSVKHLEPCGGLFLEIGAGQGSDVYEMMCLSGFKDVAVIKDLADRDRVVRGFI